MNIKVNIEKVKVFYEKIKNDENHRYKSWEHCFNYFLKPINEIDIDKASLHLAFYLASWGMYRGSSFLLQKDYLIHKKLIEDVLLNTEYRPLQKWNFLDNDQNDKNIKLLFNLKDKIEKYYSEKITKANGENAKVSDVLSTKIILGVFGCVPAYDRYFIEGLKDSNKKNSEKFIYKFNEESFKKLIDIYSENSNEIDELSKSQTAYEHRYPAMKIIDMYFWQIGFDVSIEKEELKKQNKRIRS